MDGVPGCRAARPGRGVPCSRSARALPLGRDSTAPQEDTAEAEDRSEESEPGEPGADGPDAAQLASQAPGAAGGDAL